jgi:hypothetical protein
VCVCVCVCVCVLQMSDYSLNVILQQQNAQGW